MIGFCLHKNRVSADALNGEDIKTFKVDAFSFCMVVRDGEGC